MRTASIVGLCLAATIFTSAITAGAVMHIAEARSPGEQGAPPPAPVRQDVVDPVVNTTDDRGGGGEGGPRWAFVVQNTLPAAEGEAGSVLVSLVRISNESDPPPRALPVEVAAVEWDRKWVGDIAAAPPADFTGEITNRLRKDPSVAFARTALASDGAGIEMLVPGALNASTIVIYAPASGGMLFIDWPSGVIFDWDAQEGSFRRITSALPALLAHAMEET